MAKLFFKEKAVINLFISHKNYYPKPSDLVMDRLKLIKIQWRAELVHVEKCWDDL